MPGADLWKRAAVARALVDRARVVSGARHKGEALAHELVAVDAEGAGQRVSRQDDGVAADLVVAAGTAR